MQKLLNISLALLLAGTAIVQAQEQFWTRLAPAELGTPSTHDLMHASACGRIFVASKSGLSSKASWRYSEDQGESWNTVPGLEGAGIYGLTPLADNSLLAGAKNVIYRSEDCGETWTEVVKHNDDWSWFMFTEYYTFQQEPNGTVLVRTFEQVSAASEIGYSLGDGSGTKWRVPATLPDDCEHQSALKLVSADRILCLSNLPSTGIKASDIEAVRSWEWGVLLQPNNNGEGFWNAISVGMAQNRNILVGTDNSELPFIRSVDGGDTWDFPAVQQNQPWIAGPDRILNDRLNNFFVAENRTVWYTDDLADSWSKLPEPIGGSEQIRSMCLDSANYLYAVTAIDIYRSAQPVYVVSDVHTSTQQAAGGLQIKPNPGSGIFDMSFSINTPQMLTAEVYDMHGRKIAQVFERRFAVGTHSVQGNLVTATPGVYIVKLSGAQGTQSQVLNIIR